MSRSGHFSWIKSPMRFMPVLLMTVLTCPEEVWAMNIALPAEPLAPTEFRQCSDLANRYRNIEHQLQEQANSCHRSIESQGPDIVECGTWVNIRCRASLDQCVSVRQHRRAAYERCRTHVTAAHRAKRLSTKGLGIGTAHIANNYFSSATNRTYKDLRSLLRIGDALSGRATASERYAIASDAARRLNKRLYRGSQVQRAMFDIAIRQINAVHYAALHTLDGTIERAKNITTSFESPPQSAQSQTRFAARPGSILRAREQALLEEVRSGSRAIERRRREAARAEAERGRAAANVAQAQQRANEAAFQERMREMRRETERERWRDEEEIRRSQRVLLNQMIQRQQWMNSMVRRNGGPSGSDSYNDSCHSVSTFCRVKE